MKQIAMLLMILAAVTGTVSASALVEEQAELFDTQALEDGVPEGAGKIMNQYRPTEQADFGEGMAEIFSDAAEKSGGAFRTAAAMMLRVLMIVALCQLLQELSEERYAQAACVVGALGITACCAADVNSMVGLGKTTIEEISDFSKLLLPVMASASAASGSFTGAGVMYTVTVVFSNILIWTSRAILIPVIYAYIGLAMAEAALQQHRLDKLQEFLGWLIRTGLKAIMYVFTGFLMITKILSGATDAAALKAAKVTFSGMIPVVGGIISDAAESILASAGVLKSAIGTFGMLTILAVFMLPFFKLGITYLMFKATSALGGLLGTRLGILLDALTDAMGFLLAMTGGCALMGLLACCCFLKVVQV